MVGISKNSWGVIFIILSLVTSTLTLVPSVGGSEESVETIDPGGFDWLLTQGWNLVSCPMNATFRIGANPYFDSQDALNWTNMWLINMLALEGDPFLKIMNRIGGNPSNYQTYELDTGEATAFPLDTVHGYWVYTSLPGPLIIHFDAINAPNVGGYIDVPLTAGWNLLGFQHDYSGGPGWNVAPTASMFTDGTVDTSGYLWNVLLGGAVLNKIVVTEWTAAKCYNSYVVDAAGIGFLGMPAHNWAWDLTYSTNPGNGFMLWVSNGGTITYSTTFGGSSGGSPCGDGGSVPNLIKNNQKVNGINSPPQDPYPIYGYVWDNFTAVGAGYDVYVEWTNTTDEMCPGTPLHEVTNTFSQYSVDMYDYKEGSVVWENATGPGYDGYNNTMVFLTPSGGDRVDIFEFAGPPDIWIDPLSYNFTLLPNVTDTANLQIGNDGVTKLFYSIDFSSESNALSFDGDDYVSVGDTPFIDFHAGDDFTIEAWINTTWSGVGKIIAHEYSGTYGWELAGPRADGTVSFGIKSGGSYMYAISTQTVNDGQWHHVVGKREGSTIYVYVDGTEYSASGTSGTLSNSQGVFIGKHRSDGQYDYVGIIDELRILNYSLSALDIMNDFLTFGRYPAKAGTLGW